MPSADLPSPPATRPDPRASWRTSVILAVAFWVAALGLHAVLAHLAWWLVVSLVCTAVLAAGEVAASFTFILGPVAIAALVPARGRRSARRARACDW